MLTLRKKLFIIIGISSGLVIAILLVYYLFRSNLIVDLGIKSGIISTSTPTSITDQPTIPTTDISKPISTAERVPVDMSVYAKQVAKIFVERFATNSNQNNNQNIDDVLPMSTPIMARWLESQRTSLATEYQGITTSVIASRILNIDNNSAMIEVDTQQQLMSAEGLELKQRTGRVEVNKEKGDWKVNGFYWD